MQSAFEDLELTRLDLIHAGNETFPLAARVRAVAAKDILAELKPRR
ncbi:MAG: hypothetical protein IH936_16460 [Acidobacteria bacterium]|nr:hypothetical protein [Acidobacteriota bacterium]